KPFRVIAGPVVKIFPCRLGESALAERLVDGKELVVDPADQGGRGDLADVLVDEDPSENREDQRGVVGTQELPRWTRAPQGLEFVEVHVPHLPSRPPRSYAAGTTGPPFASGGLRSSGVRSSLRTPLEPRPEDVLIHRSSCLRLVAHPQSVEDLLVLEVGLVTVLARGLADVSQAAERFGVDGVNDGP